MSYKFPLKIISSKEYDSLKNGNEKPTITQFVANNKEKSSVWDLLEAKAPRKFLEKSVSEKALFPVGVGDEVSFRKKIGRRHYEDYSQNDIIMKKMPIVAAAVEKHVDSITSGGVTIVADSKLKGKKRIKDFEDKINLISFIRNISRHGLTYGNCFVELKSMNIIHPGSMYVVRDNNGKVTGYTQWFENMMVKPVHFSPKEIAHFKFNLIGENPVYGTSIIENVRRNVHFYLQFEEDSSIVYHRKINAPFHVAVGSDDFPVVDGGILDTIAEKYANLDPNQEFVTNHLVEINTVGARGKVLDLAPFINVFRESLIMGLQVPEFLLGNPQGSNRSTADKQMEIWDVRIEALRAELGEQFEDLILKRTLGKNLSGVNFELKWGTSEVKRKEMAEHLAKFFDAKRIIPDEILLQMAKKIADIYDLEIDESKLTIPERNPGGFENNEETNRHKQDNSTST